MSDVVVNISFDAQAATISGEAELQKARRSSCAKRAAGAQSVGFGAQKIEKLIVRDGARVTLVGFAGEALRGIVASGGAVVVAKGKGRVDRVGHVARRAPTGSPAENANVTLRDAARALGEGDQAPHMQS